MLSIPKPISNTKGILTWVIQPSEASGKTIFSLRWSPWIALVTIHITLSKSLFKDVTRKHGPISCYLQPVRASTSSKREERPPRNLIFDHSKFTPEIIPRSCGQYFHPPQKWWIFDESGIHQIETAQTNQESTWGPGWGQVVAVRKDIRWEESHTSHIYFSPKPRESQGPDTRNNRIVLGRC